MKNSNSGRVAIHLGIIALLCGFAYSNTFNVPFVFDDKPNIINNPIIRNLSYYTHPGEARKFSGFAEYPVFRSRYVGSLTFALNYAIHGLDVRGYHALNLAVHIGTAIFLYLFIRAMFETPRLQASPIDRPQRDMTALFGSMLFALHPIQTQAVTYIIQRFASLASFFYILAIFGYIRFRLSETKTPRILWYSLAIAASILAAKTKEIAITLPIILALAEWLFFDDSPRRRILRLLPFALAMLVVPLTLANLDSPVDEMFAKMGNRPLYSRLQYIAIEMPVMVTYLRLLIAPINQRLDYVYPIAKGFFEPKVMIALIFHLIVLGLSAVSIARLRRNRSIFTIIPLGIFWFYITLLPESGMIPIRDVIFEHRLYLPSMGIAVAVAVGISGLYSGLGKKWRTVILVFCTAVVVALGAATWSRNAVWKSEVSIWEDVVKKEPSNTRASNNLCEALIAVKDYNKAAHYAERAVALDPSASGTFNNLGIAYAALGQYGNAIDNYKKAVRLAPNNPAPLNNMGTALLKIGLFQEATDAFRKAISIAPNYIEAHANLAAANAGMGRFDEAARQYRAILRFKPDFAGAYIGLARIALDSKSPLEAIDLLDAALRISPGNPEALSLYSFVKEKQ